MSRRKKDLFLHSKSSLFQDYKAKKKRSEITNGVSIHKRFTSRINAFYFDITHPLLTSPNEPFHNGGIDNEEFNMIVRKNFIFNSRYKAESFLGRGVFGIVYKCLDLSTGEHVAVKIVRSKPEYLKQSETEMSILYRLRKSHYVVKVLSSFFECNHRFIVFELLPYSVFRLLKISNFRGFGIYLLSRLSKHILKGINDLHKHTIIHTDLKPENVMLTKESIQRFDKKQFLRIIDFSNALDFSELRTHLQVADNSDSLQSRFYRSPEVFMGCSDVISEKLDLWSFGVMIYELFKGRPLFSGSNDFQILRKMIKTMGAPPMWMVQSGKFAHRFFHPNGELRTEEEYRLLTISDSNCGGGGENSKVSYRVGGEGVTEEEEEDVKEDNEDEEEKECISLKRRIMEHQVTPSKRNNNNSNSSSINGEEDEVNREKLEEKKTELVEFLQLFIRWDPNFRCDSQDALRHMFLQLKVGEVGDTSENEEEKEKKIEEKEKNKNKNRSLPRKQLTFSVKDVSGDVTTRKRKDSFSSFMDNDDALMEVVRKDRALEKIEEMREREQLFEGDEEDEGEEDEDEDSLSVTTSETSSGGSVSEIEEDIIASLNQQHFDVDFDVGNSSPNSSNLSTSSSSYTSEVGSISSTTSSITQGLGMIVGGQYHGGMGLMGGPNSNNNRWNLNEPQQQQQYQQHQQQQQHSPLSPSSLDYPYFEYYGDKSGHHGQRQFHYDHYQQNNRYNNNNNNNNYNRKKYYTSRQNEDLQMKRVVSSPTTVGKFGGQPTTYNDRRRTRRGSSGEGYYDTPSSTGYFNNNNNNDNNNNNRHHHHQQQQKGRNYNNNNNEPKYTRYERRRQPSSLDFDNRRGRRGRNKNEFNDRNRRRNESSPNYQYYNNNRVRYGGRDNHPPNGPSNNNNSHHHYHHHYQKHDHHRGDGWKRQRGRGREGRRSSKSAGSNAWRWRGGGGGGRRRSHGGQTEFFNNNNNTNRANDAESRGEQVTPPKRIESENSANISDTTPKEDVKVQRSSEENGNNNNNNNNNNIEDGGVWGTEVWNDLRNFNMRGVFNNVGERFQSFLKKK